MRSSDSEKLLDDIISDREYAKYRDSLWCEAKAEFRRQHPKRAFEWLLPLAAMITLLLTAIALFLSNRAPERVEVRQREKSQAPPFMVSSRALREEVSFRSETIREEVMVKSATVSALIVQTIPSKSVPKVTDAELLALFPSQPRLLATLTSGRKTFMLLDGFGD